MENINKITLELTNTLKNNIRILKKSYKKQLSTDDVEILSNTYKDIRNTLMEIGYKSVKKHNPNAFGVLLLFMVDLNKVNKWEDVMDNFSKNCSVVDTNNYEGLNCICKHSINYYHLFKSNEGIYSIIGNDCVKKSKILSKEDYEKLEKRIKHLKEKKKIQKQREIDGWKKCIKCNSFEIEKQRWREYCYGCYFDKQKLLIGCCIVDSD
jgi:hypothetical protein